MDCCNRLCWWSEFAGDNVDKVDITYRKFANRQTAVILSLSTNLEEKIVAMRHIGNLCYIGNKDKTSKLLGSTMSTILDIARDKSQPDSIRAQALRTLSLMCRRNHYAQHIAEQYQDLPTHLASIISDQKSFNLSRWACYFLYFLISDNANFLSICAGNNEIILALEKSANVSPEWRRWEQNYAELNLKILGHKPL